MRSVSSLLGAALLFSGCGPELIGIEVLPPRQSPTCSSPVPSAPAAGRGLLDVMATERFEGAYVGDLRFTGAGGTLRIDSLSLELTLPEGAGSGAKEAASNAGGIRPLGDVLLTSSASDDIAVSLVENVVLLPRSLAEALLADDELDVDATRYETVIVSLEPIVEGEGLGVRSTFPVDVCQGCLVAEPTAEDCPSGITTTGACRPGQDDVLYRCASAGSGPGFP